jgi:epoxyqueuosine reductase
MKSESNSPCVNDSAKPGSTGLAQDQLSELAVKIKQWGMELGFNQVGICDTELSEHETHLEKWLEQKFNGSMEDMARHGKKRSQPELLVPGTVRVISTRMNYLSAESTSAAELMSQPESALISRYALGRDYHKVIRKRLQKLASRIETEAGPFGYRAFVDSAPVLEKALAEKAGLGWIGKHSNLLNRQTGSWFFLGEIYTDLPLPVDQPVANHCGDCVRCIDACPTGAIVGPYQVDARKCISYLTIEMKGSIPEEFRGPMGNRIFGCDDCQVVCPWNRFAQFSDEDDFNPRQGLDSAQLIDLFAWTEEQFLKRTEGSAIRRTAYQGWLRNIAVALGNAPTSIDVVNALQTRKDETSEIVREHVEWALNQHNI